jgi:hypothetical protein
MSFSKGSITGISKKQKNNTHSSTESELVGVDDAAPQMLWTRYFIEAQGYKVDESILKQDNLSAILLETNGKGSSSKRMKHINVRYFFIKDRIVSGEITVKHCPTVEMLGDHFTKYVQGSQFRKFRAQIQGIDDNIPDSVVGWERSCIRPKAPIPQECVGERAKVLCAVRGVRTPSGSEGRKIQPSRGLTTGHTISSSIAS